MATRAYRVSGSGAATVTKVRAYRVSGTGTAATPSKLRAYRVSGSGTATASLATSKTVYEAGESVTVTAINGVAPHSFTISGVSGIVQTVVGNVLTFTAPALADPKQLTIGYKGTTFTTITIHEASVLLGPNGIPCSVYVNLPDVT
jgi:hypothetical protein